MTKTSIKLLGLFVSIISVNFSFIFKMSWSSCYNSMIWLSFLNSSYNILRQSIGFSFITSNLDSFFGLLMLLKKLSISLFSLSNKKFKSFYYWHAFLIFEYSSGLAWNISYIIVTNSEDFFYNLDLRSYSFMSENFEKIYKICWLFDYSS